jgi:hypothetical protein
MAFRLRRLSLFRHPALLLGAALLLAAVPGFAQEPPTDPAVFLIETLTVEGARETIARIVAAETLLDEGETYTEADLRQAIARVHRLPFVVDADFSLRKGSTRGAYELVIRVEPARWFFFDRQVQVVWTDVSPRTGRSNPELETRGVVGARAYLGRSGVLFGSTGVQDDLDSGATQIGYTRYDLFGRGVVANLFLAADSSCCSVVDDRVILDSSADREQLRYGLNLALPLSRFHALQLDWTERQDDLRLTDAAGQGPVVDLGGRDVAFRWVRDTSDDPLLPRHGAVLSAGLEYENGAGFVLGETPSPAAVVGFERNVAFVTATRHWPLTTRQSISTGIRVAYEVIDRKRQGVLQPLRDDLSGAVSARHLVRLWTLREPGSLGDIYLDSSATWGRDSSSPDSAFLPREVDRLELSTALVYRSQWGRLRFNFSYLGEESR